MKYHSENSAHLNNKDINQQISYATDKLFNPELINKYNRSGPRYTSYPTALEFKPIEDKILERNVLKTRCSTTPISLYFHIPFCRHLCYYCACNKIITKKNSNSGDYLNLLIEEVIKKKALLKGKPIVKQLHLGGGTPTFLTDNELSKLCYFLKEQFNFVAESEGDFSIEIDPRELRESTLKTLRSLGFNRLSFGVQDLNNTVQIAVNRIQPESLIRQVMLEARDLNYKSINIDLIYGLPYQTIESLQDTVYKIIDMSPDRLSIFNYAHLPERFKPQRQIKEENLPSPKDKLTMFGQTVNQLLDAGYQYIGIDHFAKPDDELAIAQNQKKLHRNFQGYTILGDCDLISCGVSSISQIGDYILQNDSDLSAYRQNIAENQLPAIKYIHRCNDDKIRAYAIMSLLCHNQLIFAELTEKFHINVYDYFKKELVQLGEMQKDGLINITHQSIYILPAGRLLARNIAMIFDEYLTKKHLNRFSKVI